MKREAYVSCFKIYENMKFKYTARTKTGEMQAGFVEGASREGALNLLQNNELYVLSLEALQKRKWFDFSTWFDRVRSVDLMVFTRQFATMLSAQIPISDSLKNLHRYTKSPVLQSAIFEIISDVDAGLTLSRALERHPDIFSSFYVNMVSVAEITGRLEDTFVYLADYLERQVGLTSKVRNALIYPSMLIVLSLFVMMILVVVIFPALRPLFKEVGVELPIFTKIIFGIGDFISEWWLAVLVFIIFAVILSIDYFRSDEGKTVFDDLIIRIPIVGKIVKMLYVTRFSEASSTLIKGGVPIVQAIEVASHTIDNRVYLEILQEAAETVRRGEPISTWFEQNEVYFPPLVAQMVEVGEKTGRLEKMFDKISDFYSREVENLVANLVELISPLLIVGIGIFVGLLFASVLLPIYNLTQTIGTGAGL